MIGPEESNSGSNDTVRAQDSHTRVTLAEGEDKTDECDDDDRDGMEDRENEDLGDSDSDASLFDDDH